MAEPVSRRLFFALWPDRRTRRGLVRNCRLTDGIGGRIQHPEDLHLTLVFLGPVGPEQYPCVLDVADRLRGQRFDLCIDRRGYWKRPRILWYAPSSTPGALAELVAGLQQGLTECGFEPEQRAYQAHVTVARKCPPLVAGPLNEVLHWPVGGFVLAASGSDAPSPPRYRVLKKWSLGS